MFFKQQNLWRPFLLICLSVVFRNQPVIFTSLTPKTTLMDKKMCYLLAFKTKCMIVNALLLWIRLTAQFCLYFSFKAASLLHQLNYGELHMSFTSLRNQPDVDIDPQYVHGTIYFIGIMSKINEVTKTAEDKKEGRSGVVSQSISWAYPQVENDVWHYSFPVMKLNVDKNTRNWKWKPKWKPSLLVTIRNPSNLHISVWHWAKPHSYQVLKLNQ